MMTIVKMPTDKINGVNIYYELMGSGTNALVLVHGSWGDHHNWDMVTGEFSKTFTVLTYDRRGHSKSECPSGQGSVEDDVADLIAIIEHLNLSPAHIVGNSYGAGIVLKAAAKRRDIFKSMVVHEPPLFGLLTDNPKAQSALRIVHERMKVVLDLIATGDLEKATEEFMEKIAMGPGSWEKLPEGVRTRFINNALTWYDEMQDPQSLQINLGALSIFKKPTLLSDGSASPPFFPRVIEKINNTLPHARRITIEEAGHVPHMSHPDKYVELVTKFCLSI